MVMRKLRSRAPTCLACKFKIRSIRAAARQVSGKLRRLLAGQPPRRSGRYRVRRGYRTSETYLNSK